MIIIPDIHGRSFWREAVCGRETEDIIFLGDYLDPYSGEGIFSGQTLDNLRDIISFKQAHPDNVTLLLGNHDLGYLCPDINMCRQDADRYDEIQDLLKDNAGCFQLCTSREVGGKTYLFSHSFVSRYWMTACQKYLHFDYSHPSEIADILNCQFREQQEKMFELLAIASHHRGGFNAFGSMVWSDVLEVGLPNPFLDGVVNVFGHSQVREPIITDHFACLDVMRAFELSDDETFKQL